VELLFHELCLWSWRRVNSESVRDVPLYRREGRNPVRLTSNVLDDDLLGQIVTEAKRVLAEVGLEIRGQALRERLLDAGLPLDATGALVVAQPRSRLAALAAAWPVCTAVSVYQLPR